MTSLDNTCLYCSKTFSKKGNCKRHLSLCKVKNSLIDDNQILIKKLLEGQRELLEHNKLMDQKIENLERENKELKKQIRTKHITVQGDVIQNADIIHNGNGDIHNNNYHMKVTPGIFGKEKTDHITKHQVNRIIKNHPNAEVLHKIVKAIYNNQRIPENMTILRCCEDPLCNKVKVHRQKGWTTEEFEGVAQNLKNLAIDVLYIDFDQTETEKLDTIVGIECSGGMREILKMYKELAE